MGAASRATATQRAADQDAVEQARASGQRVHLEELEFLRLTSAHGEIFASEAEYRQKIEALQAEARKAVGEKQQAFDAAMKKLAKAHKFDAARVKQWDKDTLDLILG